MTYYSGAATIIQGERRIDVASCRVEMDHSGRIPGWLGTFILVDPIDDPDITQDETVLELEDGRRGDILLTRVLLGAGSGSFRGTGPPPG